MKRKRIRKVLCFILAIALAFPVMTGNAKETSKKEIVINVLDYGADPSGVNDSAKAVWKALEAAKEASDDGKNHVTLNFPKGEYHIYKDKAQQREYHTSNTNSIENPVKTIGILIEEQKNLTLEGNGSLFIMHGNMMALAVAKSEDIVLHDFSWDFAVPTVSEMTITGMGEEAGRQYTDFYIPSCFPYEIQGNTILWKSELSPYTGKTYWTEKGIHNAYSVVAFHPDEEMTRAYFTNEGPFQNVSSIEQLDDNKVRIHYSSGRPAMQKEGMVLELASSAVRETAGAFTWESENVRAEKINVHFMHGFGWLIQMSKDVYYKDCNMMPRENSGHLTVSYADGIHASGAAGEIVIENCNFSNTHDDPINLHGTFTRVEQRIDDHTLQLKYIHTQQGGFPQYHIGDMVQFFTRDTLESTDGETGYEVTEVVSNPGEDGNDLRTMVIRFKEKLPENLSDRLSGQPKYVAENVTYAPAVTIKNCTFKNVPTRGILCTTRNPVVIEGNTFYNMSMATIYLSNDSDEWYESGPIRDMTIRNNTFYIKDIGRTSWEYASAIYIHPVTKGGGLPSAENPIHKNIAIEGNTFYMDLDTVVKAESVENLTFRNNQVFRMNPDVKIDISMDDTTLNAGATKALNVNAQGNTNDGTIDNVFEFTKSKNVVIEGNTYDDGLKRYAVAHDDATADSIKIQDEDITLVRSRDEVPSEPVREIRYASSNPEIATVDTNGTITGKQAGTTEVFAYYEWNDTIVRSNTLTVTVEGNTSGDTVAIQEGDNQELTVGETAAFTVQGNAQVTWSVQDFETGEATDAAVISENGVLTALKNGVVWVTASSGIGTDRKAVVISGGAVAGLGSEFSVVREDKSNYRVRDGALEVTMQKGDLYTTENTVKNLVLYNPTDVDKNNLRTVVKVDGLPARENGQWDTASFVLYKDDDNYVTIGKKSHYDGFASVNEKNGAAAEAGGNASDNEVVSAYLGFTKQGNTISLDYKREDGTWQNLKTITDSTIGDNYQIGMAAWATNLRGKKVAFSDFHVGSADMTYDALCQTEAIPFQKQNNQRPSVNDTTLVVNQSSATISYQFTDPDGDAEGRSLYRWYWEQDGKEQSTVTTAKTFDVAGISEISCRVYPVDAHGMPGTPGDKVKEEVAAEDTTELYSISVNGGMVYKRGGKETMTVLVPEELKKIVLSYVSVNDQNGNIQITQNGTTIGGDYKNSDSLILNVKNEDEITLAKGAFTYTLKIKTVASNITDLQSISMENLGFDVQSPFDTKSYVVFADETKSSSELVVAASENTGSVQILKDEYREEVQTNKNGDTYTANLQFRNGLNTYYVKAIAKDGKTTKQYVLNVVYAPSSEVKVNGIRLNGAELQGFDENTFSYSHEMGYENELFVQVDASEYTDVKISLNGDVQEGKEVTYRSFQEGENELIIEAKAKDGLVKKVYMIQVLKPYETNANLKAVVLNEKDITSSVVDSNDKTEQYISSEQAALKVTAQDARATVIIEHGGKEVSKNVQETQVKLDIYQGAETIKITVVAADQTTKNVYEIVLKKGEYLSDMEWSSATIGYEGDGGIKKDLGYAGGALRLPDADGNPITFAKGIGTHAESIIKYDLSEKKYQKLTGYVGIDYAKYNDPYGEVEFIIEVDGTVLFESGSMLQKTSMKAFDVTLPEGAKELTLKALSGENNWSDHADWADVKLIGQFEKQPVDKTALEAIIADAKTLKAEDYTASSLAAYLDLCKEKESLLDQETEQAELDAAVEELNQMKKELVYIGGLRKVIEEYEALESEKYEQESFKHLTDTLDAAKVVLENGQATVKEVEEMIQKLNEAYSNLKPYEEPVVPEPPKDPEPPKKPQQPTDSGQSKDPQQLTGSEDGKGVQTGDTVNLPMIILLLGMSVSIITFRMKKKGK